MTLNEINKITTRSNINPKNKIANEAISIAVSTSNYILNGKKPIPS